MQASELMSAALPQDPQLVERIVEGISRPGALVVQP